MLSRLSFAKTCRLYTGSSFISSQRSYGSEIFKKFANQPDASHKAPAPHKLPLKDQLEFENLLQKVNSALIFEEYNESVAKNKLDDINDAKKFEQLIKEKQEQLENFKGLEENAPPAATKTYSTNTIPEFEGNVNPKTGEVNGPKQDPLKYGDWSFNGRVTDF